MSASSSAASGRAARLAPLRQAARDWAAIDPDPETRAEALALAEAPDSAETEAALVDAFGGRLSFGTAGIRGRMGAGPGRMNRVVVRQTTLGFAHYLNAARRAGTVTGDTVVVGYDGRRNSRIFAEEAAAQLAGEGLRARIYPHPVPTPVLAHAVVAHGAIGGVMVTASHNPPADNGYKVYWGNGAQIVPPHDAGIAAEIARIGPRCPGLPPDIRLLKERGRVTGPDPAVMEDYLARVLALRVHTGASIRTVYTAMHGVGHATLQAVLERAGDHELVPVPEQVEPDGAFPTVAFPNPEEPGALDLAMARATAAEAALIVAHDPDADRLAVAVPDPAAPQGWRQLSGNEVGLLLAHDLLDHGDTEGAGAQRLVATTVVSTTLLAHLAALRGVQYAETLTGFKWIANAAIDAAAQGVRFVVGFEEALGYSAGDVVRDKDGVSAALLLMDLAAWCAARGTSLAAHLDAVYGELGYAASLQHSVKLPGAAGKARIDAAMETLRRSPPAALGGLAVRRVRDLATATATDRATGETSPLTFPKSNVLVFDLEGDARVVARPSGTEPKLKFYVELRAPVGKGGVAAARETADAALAPLLAGVLAAAGLD